MMFLANCKKKNKRAKNISGSTSSPKLKKKLNFKGDKAGLEENLKRSTFHEITKIMK